MTTRDKAIGTLPRSKKGPLGPPPPLSGNLKTIADAVASWPGVDTSIHWSLDHSRPDGVDFYLEDSELGHLHLDGSIHLATNPRLGKQLVAEGVAKFFRFQIGWVEQDVDAVGAKAGIALFRRHYDELRG